MSLQLCIVLYPLVSARNPDSQIFIARIHIQPHTNQYLYKSVFILASNGFVCHF